MHDVLRTRLLRKLESLPEDQVYQILDYIEFLESKYAPDLSSETTVLQSFAEKLEDQLRRRTVSPASLREAFQLISAADKVLSNVANMGKELLGDSLGILKHNSDQQSQHVEFEVRIVARLAWIEPRPDKTFAIGLEFDRGPDGEELIG